jgi:hypothetical protein
VQTLRVRGTDLIMVPASACTQVRICRRAYSALTGGCALQASAHWALPGLSISPSLAEWLTIARNVFSRPPQAPLLITPCMASVHVSPPLWPATSRVRLFYAPIGDVLPSCPF